MLFTCGVESLRGRESPWIDTSSLSRWREYTYSCLGLILLVYHDEESICIHVQETQGTLRIVTPPTIWEVQGMLRMVTPLTIQGKFFPHHIHTRAYPIVELLLEPERVFLLHARMHAKVGEDVRFRETLLHNIYHICTLVILGTHLPIIVMFVRVPKYTCSWSVAASPHSLVSLPKPDNYCTL